MSLLHQLLQADHAANSANPANQQAKGNPAPPKISRISRNSTGADVYARLLALADTADCERASYFDRAIIHRLGVDVLTDLANESDNALLAYLTALADDADRQAGRVPAGHDAAILCEHCGAVWVHPDTATGVAVVDGWPRVHGCPWCMVKGRIPRPPVRADTCIHFVPDHLNPKGGTGKCECGYSLPWATRPCNTYQPLEVAA